MAPLQKRLEGVSELSKHKDDKVPLKQATFHEQRVFLPSKKEREQITLLNVEMEIFIQTSVQPRGFSMMSP